MPNYISRCPGCHSTKDDIGWAGSYFEVYECGACQHHFCFKCRNSNNGRYCPECKSDDFSTYGRVSKG